MNCAECQEQLVSYIEQLLDDVQAAQVVEHLETCASCRAELEGLQTLQTRLVENAKAVAQSDLEEDVMNRIIREQGARLKSAAQASKGLRLRRLLMKSPITRIAAAAVVVVACALAFSMWKDTGAIALADVLAKVEQMQAFFYQETGTTQDQTRGDSTSASTVLVSSVYGAKMETTTVDAEGQETQLLTYLLPQEKDIVIVDVSAKRYAHRPLDEATLANMGFENRDPREMIKRLLACEYRELGRAVIDGVTAQGFETTDPSYLGNTVGNLSARLWVAVDTSLPVRYELETGPREGVHTSSVQDGFQWDVPVNAGEFEPDIPADFTADRTDGMQTPSYSEAGMIEALKLAADLTGHYPATLDIQALQQVMMEIATSDTPAARQLRQEWKNAGSPEAAARMSQQRLMSFMVVTTFPRMLAAQGAEPIYHGDVVTPDDVELPLMRWKVADDQYQVIFGDLHTETVSADVLAELEAALPQ